MLTAQTGGIAAVKGPLQGRAGLQQRAAHMIGCGRASVPSHTNMTLLPATSSTCSTCTPQRSFEHCCGASDYM